MEVVLEKKTISICQTRFTMITFVVTNTAVEMNCLHFVKLIEGKCDECFQSHR